MVLFFFLVVPRSRARFVRDLRAVIALTTLGDLLLFNAVHRDGTPFLIASFHSDSNGLATLPVNLADIHVCVRSHKSNAGILVHIHIVGPPSLQDFVHGTQGVVRILTNMRAIVFVAQWRTCGGFEGCAGAVVENEVKEIRWKCGCDGSQTQEDITS